jgi:hypothetical protein
MEATMVGLAGAMKKHSNQRHAQNKNAPEEPPPVPVGVQMQPCMKKICDELRLNERTRTALVEYDATTLEDLAYMTDGDYENMLATAARQNRPLCPLQQRKIAVVIWWIRDLVKDSAPFKEPTVIQKDPGFWQRLAHSPAEWNQKVHSVVSFGADDKSTKSVDTGSVIPPNWESRFEEDLPMLKKKLKEVGETSSFSLYSDFFINARWIFCGYTH